MVTFSNVILQCCYLYKRQMYKGFFSSFFKTNLKYDS